MKVLLALLLLLPVTGQKPVEPVRISILTVGETETDREIERALRGRLGRLREKERDLLLVSQRADYVIEIAVAPLTPDNSCTGFAGAMKVSDKADRYVWSLHTGRDVESLAGVMAGRLRDRIFQARR